MSDNFVIMPESDYVDICDKIRLNLETTDIIKSEDIPSAIDNIKDKMYHVFWDEYQKNGLRLNYAYAFCGVGWNSNTFKPKYNIVPNDVNSMFIRFNEGNDAISLIEKLNELGIVIDFSNVTHFYNVASYANIIDFPELDLTSARRLYCTFSNSICKTIQNITSQNDEITAVFDGVFDNAIYLENIQFDKIIATSLNLQSCPLSIQSLLSIVNHLKNYIGSDEAYTKSLYLSSKSWEKLDLENPISGIIIEAENFSSYIDTNGKKITSVPDMNTGDIIIEINAGATGEGVKHDNTWNAYGIHMRGSSISNPVTYNVNTIVAGDYSLIMRAKINNTRNLLVTVNGTTTSVPVTYGEEWVHINLGTFSLNQGSNTISFEIDAIDGTLNLDYIKLVDSGSAATWKSYVYSLGWNV